MDVLGRSATEKTARRTRWNASAHAQVFSASKAPRMAYFLIEDETCHA
jgi:hypothetical protein